MQINIRNIQIGNDLPMVLIAGPCQIESLDHSLMAADFLCNLTNKLNIPFVFKSSFDKANRTSITGKRGVGLAQALPIFRRIKERFDVPILTDVHSVEQCQEIAEVADVLQIPAFLCRQTDLLLAAGKTGKAINVKKGQFMAPWDMEHVAAKIASTGNHNIMLCERGVTFGYNRLVNDMRAIPIMKDTGYPVVFDATHSVQEPSAQNGQSGGERRFVTTLATAAVAIGIAALFVETHEEPSKAPSDGPCMLPFADLPAFLQKMQKLDALAV